MDKFDMIRRIKLELSGVKSTKMEEGGLENACWDGYEPIGLKDDGSPNCVPIKEEQSKVKEGFPIPSPNSDEDEQAYVSRCISNIIDEYGQEQSAAICYNRWQNQ
jgi:hypothetical protein